MNFLVILLSVILIIVIVYMIYTSIYSTTLISKEVDMKDKIADINASSLIKPDAVRYSYNVWIYMDNQVSGEKQIFKRENDLGLFIDGTTSTLSMKLYRRKVTNDSSDTTSYQISNNFPLQKWTLITISIDNSTIDMYLDGKLVKSVIDPVGTGGIKHSPDNTSSISFGVIPGTYMSKFSRVLSPSNPQTAWSLYMEGSGSDKGLANLVNRYNMNISLMRDNAVARSISLF
jgi:hypothetical protein